MEQQEPKVLVCITSYNRRGNLCDLVAELIGQNNCDIVIFDDCSDFDITKWANGDRIVIKRNPEHRGKEGFWKTWQDIFNYCKEHEYDYHIFLQDDVLPCPDFIERAIDIYNEAESICVSPIRTNYSMYQGKSRWGAKPVERHENYTVSHYFDCFGIVKRDFFEALDWMIVPIAPSADPFKSSGVGRQITRRLQEKGWKMSHVNRTLLSTAIDPTASLMNEQERQRHPMVADWSDNENCVDVHMASLWRDGHLLKTLGTLCQQPETATIFVTLNNYTQEQYNKTMEGIKELVCKYGKRIVTRRAKNQKGSNEKLSQLPKSTAPYIAFADDDLLYSHDYFLRLIHGIRIHDAAVSFHGSNLNEFPTKKYYSGRRIFSFNATVEADAPVDLIGSGVALFRREWFSTEELKALYADAPAVSMDDIILSCALSQKGISRWVLEHPFGLIRTKDPKPEDCYVYDQYKNNDSAQVEYVNANYKRK